MYVFSTIGTYSETTCTCTDWYREIKTKFVEPLREHILCNVWVINVYKLTMYSTL